MITIYIYLIILQHHTMKKTRQDITHPSIKSTWSILKRFWIVSRTHTHTTATRLYYVTIIRTPISYALVRQILHFFTGPPVGRTSQKSKLKKVLPCLLTVTMKLSSISFLASTAIVSAFTPQSVGRKYYGSFMNF